MVSEAALDVVVVNVGGDAAIDDVVRGANSVRVIAVDNRGYAAAVNTGAAVALGDVVVFSNDDVMVTAAEVSQLAASVRTGGADVALPRLFSSDGREAGTTLALPTLHRLFVEWALLPDRPIGAVASRFVVEKWRRPLSTQKIQAGTAAVVAVRADVLRDIPIPEAYFLYWEELEWFWLLHARGKDVVLAAEVTVLHDGGRDVREEKSRLLARNAVRCVRRTQGRRAALWGYGIVILWNARLVAVDAVRTLVRPRLVPRTRGAGMAGLVSALGSWRELA